MKQEAQFHLQIARSSAPEHIKTALIESISEVFDKDIWKYQVLELIFQTAMTIKTEDYFPNLPKTFSGYLLGWGDSGKDLVNKNLSYEQKIKKAIEIVSAFQSRTDLPFGFHTYSLSKTSNVNILFEDYNRFLESISQNELVGGFKKFKSDESKSIVQTYQEMIKESLYIRGRPVGDIVSFNKENGEMQIYINRFEYFTDFVAISIGLWGPFFESRRAGNKKNPLWKFIANKIKFQHYQFQTGQVVGKNVPKALILDEDFFDTNFSADRIAERASNNTETFKARKSICFKSGLIDEDFIQKLLSETKDLGLPIRDSLEKYKFFKKEESIIKSFVEELKSKGGEFKGVDNKDWRETMEEYYHSDQSTQEEVRSFLKKRIKNTPLSKRREEAKLREQQGLKDIDIILPTSKRKPA